MLKSQVKSAIQQQREIIDSAKHEIERIGGIYIPDYHFLNHRISSYWDCETSPTGLCVFDISEGQIEPHQMCIYCNGPVERK